MLLRKKKKQKKAQQLQEAQHQAFLASLQLQNQNVAVQQPPHQYSQTVGGTRRPPSAMSVPAMTFHDRDYDDEEISGSDQDLEMMDSLEMQRIGESSLNQQQQQHSQRLILDGQDHSSPSQPPYPIHHQSSLQYPGSLMSSLSMQNLSKEYAAGYRKAPLPQPAFIMQQPIPAPATELPLQPAQSVTQPTQIPQQIQMSPRQRTNGNSTLKKFKDREPLTPEKIELITTALSLGLGRGIDATDKMPWVNKTPFQVRRVHTGVIETNEGSIAINYNHEVQSVAEIEEKFLSSVNPPEATVKIFIEDELDRTVSSTRRIVGQRVINRTISFQADFEEKYKDGETSKFAKESFLIPKDPAEVVHNTQESGYTFEERVCKWMLHRLVRKCSATLQKTEEGPIEQLARQMESKNAVAIEKEIKAGCLELVQCLRLTHYVTGLQLGAAEYRIMSDGQYHKQIASKGAFGLDRLASSFSKNTEKQSKKETMKCSQPRKLGKIEDDRVAKGTQDEVVLQVQVQPISRLIKLPVLKLALQAAIEKYMEGTPSSEGGPFVIKCTGRDLYLTVNKFNNYEVEGTDIPTEASLFYFQTTDDGGNPFEFHIAYYGEDADPNDQTTETSSICRYLEAPLNSQGRCPGPLLMKHSVKVKNTRFTLRSRLSKKSSKSHLEEWIAGEDAFYVACATKKYQHGSYLAVKNSKNTGDLIGKHFYMTCCDPSIHNHNGENSFMLFQLCTKDSIISKQQGRETPGKLPILQPAKEVETRKAM